MKKRTATTRLLVQLDMRQAASREMVGGVLRFAAAHHDLEVQFATTEPVDYYSAWKPDGLITDSGCLAYSKSEFSSLAGRSVVYVNVRPRTDVRRDYATITTDERLLAVAATELFTSKKLNNLAFVGTVSKERWSDARGRLFKAALKDRGFKLTTFQCDQGTDWRAQAKSLSVWLKQLPKPCGVWAACDLRAKQVLDACHQAEVSVPEQVQVMGVDDETYICEQTRPSLSSLAPDFEAGGYACAEHLYNVLSGKTPKANKTVLKFGLKGAVERLSTADVNGTARRVAQAREFIRMHATTGISVPDVALSLGVSTRLLEKNYREVTGHTVLEDLQEARLTKVREMLRKTTIPIDNIGPFCGFNSPTHLKTLFKKTFGVTMSGYRANGK